MSNPDDPSTLTVAELFKHVETKELAVMLSEVEEDYGVVIAKGSGLKFLLGIIAQQTSVVATSAAEKRTHEIIGDDPEMGKSLGELRAEMPFNGILAIARNEENGDHFIGVAAKGTAAEVVYNILVESGVLKNLAATNPPTHAQA